jgi:hypothetical protein
MKRNNAILIENQFFFSKSFLNGAFFRFFLFILAFVVVQQYLFTAELPNPFNFIFSFDFKRYVDSFLSAVNDFWQIGMTGFKEVTIVDWYKPFIESFCNFIFAYHLIFVILYNNFFLLASCLGYCFVFILLALKFTNFMKSKQKIIIRQSRQKRRLRIAQKNFFTPFIKWLVVCFVIFFLLSIVLWQYLYTIELINMFNFTFLNFQETIRQGQEIISNQINCKQQQIISNLLQTNKDYKFSSPDFNFSEFGNVSTEALTASSLFSIFW